MKLRKILAGFLAGTIAMTSSVVMSVTASAEELTGSNLSCVVILKTTSGWTEHYSSTTNLDADGTITREDEWATFESGAKVAIDTSADLYQTAARIYYYDGNSDITLDDFIVPVTYSAKMGSTDILASTTSTVAFSRTNETSFQGDVFFSTPSGSSGSVADYFGENDTISTSISVDLDAAIPVTTENALYIPSDASDNYVIGDGGASDKYEITLADYVSDPAKIASALAVFSQKKDSYSYMGGRITDYNEANVLASFGIENNTFIGTKATFTNESCGGKIKIVFDYLKYDVDYENKLCYVEFYDANGEVLAHVDSTTEKIVKNSITIDETIENGAIAVDGDLTEAAVGNTVTLKVTPDKYYKLGTLTVMGEEAVTTTDNEDSTYSFEMPAAEVSVKAEFIVDTAALKTDIDAAVKSLATVTKASTYTTADYEADLKTAIKTIEFTGLTVDTSALKETKATEEATGSIAGTVTIEAGETAITTLTANVTLDKVPTDPVEVAAEAVKAYLAKVTFDNEFHATNQAEAIKAEVAKVAPKVRVDPSFTVLAATEDAAGSVTGTIKLVADGSEPKTIEVNETIAKLPAKNLVYADNQPALEALKADGKTVLTQTATQADGKLKSQRFVQKVTMDDVKKATGVRYDFMRSDGKTCSITGDYQCYYKSVAGVQAGTDEAFLSVTMKNIPKDMIVMCTITLLYN